MNALFEQMLHTWTSGGWVMAALVMVALITYSSGVHLLLSLRQRGMKQATDQDLKLWVAEPERAPEMCRELIRYTQDQVGSLRQIEGRFREVEASKVPALNRRVAFLNIMVVSAPLFGLLGTVLGMLLTFRAIGVGGSSTSDVIAKGISEALVATQTGMLVAIPGLIMVHVAKRRRNEFIAFLLRLESITLRHFRPTFRGMTRFFTQPRPTNLAPTRLPGTTPVPMAAQ
jgi:biopolymer transport protein ExbB